MGIQRARVGALGDKSSGIEPFLLGEMASAFYGGRIEARLVGVAASMALVDQSKTYAAMLSLLDLGRYYGADHFEVEAVDPEEVRRFLMSRAWRDDRAAWRYLGGVFVRIRPRGALALPSHVEWSPDYDGLTVAPLDLMGGARTFHGCDIAAAVEEGADPECLDIMQCWRLTATGRQWGLRRVRLLSGRMFDLQRDDLGAALIDDCNWAQGQCDRPWLTGLAKRYAQVAAFGGLARHDRRSLDEPVEHFAYGPEGAPMSVTTSHPEVPGPHAFLPLAAAVCAGARLSLAMVHRMVHDE